MPPLHCQENWSVYLASNSITPRMSLQWYGRHATLWQGVTTHQFITPQLKVSSFLGFKGLMPGMEK